MFREAFIHLSIPLPPKPAQPGGVHVEWDKNTGSVAVTYPEGKGRKKGGSISALAV